MHINAVWFNSYLKAGGQELILIGINSLRFSNDGVPIWGSLGSVFRESLLLVHDAASLVYLLPKFRSNKVPSKSISQWRGVIHQKNVVIENASTFSWNYSYLWFHVGSVCGVWRGVVQLVEALFYKRVRFQIFHWQSYQPHFDPGVDSAF
jgi:hypothetical protein